MLASGYDFANCVVYPRRNLSQCEKGIRTKIFKNKTAAHPTSSTLKETKKKKNRIRIHDSAHACAMKSLLKTF